MASLGQNDEIADLLEREEKKAKERLRLQRMGDYNNPSVKTEVTDDVKVKMENVYDSASLPSASLPSAALPSSHYNKNGRRANHESRPSSSYSNSKNDSRPTSSRSNQSFGSKDRYQDEREENNQRRARRNQADDDKGGNGRRSANDGVRSRRESRSRSPRPDNRRNHRSRERIGGGDYYRRGRADQDYDDDDRHYRPDRRGGRHHSRDRGGRGRDDRDHHGRDYQRPRDRSPRGNKRKTPEPTDDERDRRTVFVQQLAARLRSKDLKTFFAAAGTVVDAQIVKDRVSHRSKGVGYVEFKDEESVQKAIGLTGQKLLGIPIIAQLTEAEKNRQARTNEGGATHSNGIPFHRLYVGNIHFSIGEDDLKSVFESFGELEFVQLQKEEGGRSKGYGFVQFIDPAQAKKALESMNGFELAGRPIRVGLGNDKFTPESTQNLMRGFGNQGGPGASFSGMGGRGAQAGGTGNFDRPAARDVDKAGGAGALDDSDVGGVNFNNFNRDALMRKLARVDEPEQKIAPKTQTRAAQPAPVYAQAASRCIVAKNLYQEKDKVGQNWKQEIEEDVRTECNNSYGRVLHVGVSPDGEDGQVYVKFADVASGERAIRGLSGRYFDGNMVTAEPVVEAIYNMNFPKAPNA